MAKLDDKEIQTIITNEIAWCTSHPDELLSSDYQKGFKLGLIQAGYLLSKVIKVKELLDDNIEEKDTMTNLNNMEWEISRPQKITLLNNYLDGGELLSIVCPPQGVSIWATVDFDHFNGTVIVFGQGDTEDEARKNLKENIDKFVGILNG